MEEHHLRFGLLDAMLAGAILGLLFAFALAVLSGCTIRDGYVVERPAIAVSGEYYSPGYGGVSVAVATPSLYPGYGYYGYDPYDYSGYRRYYQPRVIYRRPYYRQHVIHRTRVVHHHHHPAYRERGIVPAHRYRHPVSPPTYRRPVAGAHESRNMPPRRRPLRARRF